MDVKAYLEKRLWESMQMFMLNSHICRRPYKYEKLCLYPKSDCSACLPEDSLDSLCISEEDELFREKKCPKCNGPVIKNKNAYWCYSGFPESGRGCQWGEIL